MIKGIIFDFNRTIYNPDSGQLTRGALELLEFFKARGYPMCLLSKKTEDERREHISKLGLDKYFIDIQVIDGDKTLDNFQHCLEVLGFMPEEILVVGDRIKSEIILANQMGMKTVWYKSGKFAGEAPESEDEEPDWVVGELGEVGKIAKK